MTTDGPTRVYAVHLWTDDPDPAKRSHHGGYVAREGTRMDDGRIIWPTPYSAQTIRTGVYVQRRSCEKAAERLTKRDRRERQNRVGVATAPTLAGGDGHDTESWG